MDVLCTVIGCPVILFAKSGSHRARLWKTLLHTKEFRLCSITNKDPLSQRSDIDKVVFETSQKTMTAVQV